MVVGSGRWLGSDNNLTNIMTVSELIDFLKTQPQHLPVAYRAYSEQSLLEAKDVKIEELCEPRPDGWVQDRRPDMPTCQYLVFPGN